MLLEGIGAGLEILFPNKAQAAEMFTPGEISKLGITEKFQGADARNQEQAQILKDKGIAGL